MLLYDNEVILLM